MKLPIKKADFLLPKANIDYLKWAVIACDQHTGNKEYWHSLYEYVGSSKSTLNIIYPEAFLDEDRAKRIEKIAFESDFYIKDDSFDEYFGMVYIERGLKSGKKRKGLLALIDLESYSYETKSLCRASEGTVLQRIPPRVQIRESSMLEASHVMILYDDPNHMVLNAVNESEKSPLYNFELNMGGGNILGSLIQETSKIESAFGKLLLKAQQNSDFPLLLAVGDGNHSLATAKKVYENQKAQGINTDKSRYALAEFVNIYDEGLDFEPIYRITTGKDTQKVFEGLSVPKDGYVECRVFLCGDEKNIYLPADPIYAISYLDSFLSGFDCETDYIHGENELKRLCAQNHGLGVVLKGINKDGFFPYIDKNGALPKKTFSMGHAEEKRYYLEVRKIK